jgi:hypothetical protein
MSVMHRLVGPRSKYDRSLPYTYLAKVVEVDGVPDLAVHYYADTICGLTEYLAEYGIAPEQVELFGMYLDRAIRIDKEICLDTDRKWLRRPELCGALEKYYRANMEQQYVGHRELVPCSYTDRDRRASGPYG